MSYETTAVVGRRWVVVLPLGALDALTAVIHRYGVRVYVLIDFLTFLLLSSSAGYVGASPVSQSSHLNNAFLYYLPASLFPFSLFFRRTAFFHKQLVREGFAFIFNTSAVSIRYLGRAQPFLFALSITYTHAYYGVRVVFREHGALGVCKSPVCSWSHGPLCPLHSRFVLFFLVRASVAARGAKRLFWCIISGTFVPGIMIHDRLCEVRGCLFVCSCGEKLSLDDCLALKLKFCLVLIVTAMEGLLTLWSLLYVPNIRCIYWFLSCLWERA